MTDRQGCYWTEKHENQNVRLTYRPDKNGAPRWQRQCMECGRSVGNFIRKIDAEREAGQLADIPAFNEALPEKVHRQHVSERLAGQQAEKQEWWDWYNQYLNSDAWRVKAALVHRRAKGICEGCLSAPSTQVHHLTYDHAGDEFLFELVAICDACHEHIHSKDETQE